MACNLYAELFHLIHGKPARPLNFWAAACALPRAKAAGWGEASLENTGYPKISSGPPSQAIAHSFLLLVGRGFDTPTSVQLSSSW
jgi:hypothetical protein